MQQYAGPQGYAVLKARTKKFKKTKLDRRAWIRCDRGGKPEKNSKSKGKRITDSRLMDCPFLIIAARPTESDLWTYEIIRRQHNHGPTIEGSHTSLRKIARTTDVEDTVINQSRTGSKPSKVLSSLRLGLDEENPMLKPSDVYNIKAKARSEALGSLTPVQALLRQLHHRDDWFVTYDNHKTSGRLEFLFFSRKSAQKILRLNYEVLILDCTYKTNRYNIPLMVITGVTAMNTSYYVAFAFMKDETVSGFKWMLEQLKLLYNELDIPYPDVLLTDCDKHLMTASLRVFPDADHIICIWHVDNNVNKNCNLHFDTKEEWEDFFRDWHRVMYATSEAQHEHEWGILQSDYSDDYPIVIQYLVEHLLLLKKRFVAAWTNKMLTFNNRATSRGESNNGKLNIELNSCSIGKQALNDILLANTLAGDLKHVVDSIDILLSNERSNYKLKLDEAKMKAGRDIRVLIFRDVLERSLPLR